MRLGLKFFFRGILSSLSKFISSCTVYYDSSCYFYASEQNVRHHARSLLSVEQIYEEGGGVATRDLALAYVRSSLS